MQYLNTYLLYINSSKTGQGYFHIYPVGTKQNETIAGSGPQHRSTFGHIYDNNLKSHLDFCLDFKDILFKTIRGHDKTSDARVFSETLKDISYIKITWVFNIMVHPHYINSLRDNIIGKDWKGNSGFVSYCLQCQFITVQATSHVHLHLKFWRC